MLSIFSMTTYHHHDNRHPRPPLDPGTAGGKNLPLFPKTRSIRLIHDPARARAAQNTQFRFIGLHSSIDTLRRLTYEMCRLRLHMDARPIGQGEGMMQTRTGPFWVTNPVRPPEEVVRGHGQGQNLVLRHAAKPPPAAAEKLVLRHAAAAGA